MRLTSLLNRRPFQLPPTPSGLFASADAQLKAHDERRAEAAAAVDPDDATNWYENHDRIEATAKQRCRLAAVIVSGMRADHLAALPEETRLRLLAALNDTPARYETRAEGAGAAQRLLEVSPLPEAHVARRLREVADLAALIRTDDALRADQAGWRGFDGLEKAEAMTRLMARYAEISGTDAIAVSAFALPRDGGFVRKTSSEDGRITLNIHPDAPIRDYADAALLVFAQGLANRRSAIESALSAHESGYEPMAAPPVGAERLVIESGRASTAGLSAKQHDERPGARLEAAMQAALRRALRPTLLETLAAGLVHLAGPSRPAPRR